jgi:hypothetical protein
VAVWDGSACPQAMVASAENKENDRKERDDISARSWIFIKGAIEVLLDLPKIDLFVAGLRGRFGGQARLLGGLGFAAGKVGGQFRLV